MKAKVNLRNILAYITGNLRYSVYYSKYKGLLREHIIEQIDFRIKVMDSVCYEEGSCKLCGCTTTKLQMANKSCDKPCYPTMMNRKHWRLFKISYPHYDKSTGLFWVYSKEGILTKYIRDDYVGEITYRDRYNKT